jgi:beta-ribofuranosylaminobenzene 5'-phosphate synthase
MIQWLEVRHAAVSVEAPARIHFGMLDLGGSLGRRFGGIGVGVHPPLVRLTVSAARDLIVTADASDVAGSRLLVEARGVVAQAAERVLEQYRITDRVHVALHQLLPAHHGLGSGTQLALATARGIAHLYNLPVDTLRLAVLLGRARRSAIGTYVFDGGGLIVEGGRRPDVDRPAPLVTRLPLPPLWRCVLVLPPGHAGLSGSTEAEAFAALPTPAVQEAERVAHVTLMGLLPAIADGDFAGFGGALSEIQSINGRWFSSAQGGAFGHAASTEIVATLNAWGETGIGQSSWGPAVYAIAPDPDRSAALASRLSARFPSAVVLDAAFSAHGARVVMTD